MYNPHGPARPHEGLLSPPAQSPRSPSRGFSCEAWCHPCGVGGDSVCVPVQADSPPPDPPQIAPFAPPTAASTLWASLSHASRGRGGGSPSDPCTSGCGLLGVGVDSP